MAERGGGGAGAFVTVEGGDGAGKSTQVGFIGEWLGGRGVDVVATREPGGTAAGEQLREMLLGGGVALSATCELMLMFAARAQHLDEVIRPALAAGKWVLCDRFSDATYAYQGGGRGVDAARIAALEGWVQGDLQPDLTLLLDVPVETGLARTQQRGGGGDRFEGERLAFKQAVRRAYCERAAEDAARIKRIDATPPAVEVSAAIGEVLAAFWRGRA